MSAARQPQESSNMLRFAHDLARLRENLEHEANEYLPPEHQSPSAVGFLVLLHELTAGTDATQAVAKAMRGYNRVRDRQKDHEESTSKRRALAAAELEQEEQVTRKVECPFCGVSAGMKCRGTGASGGLRKESHKDRFRLARSLNDGAAEEAVEA